MVDPDISSVQKRMILNNDKTQERIYTKWNRKYESRQWDESGILERLGKCVTFDESN